MASSTTTTTMATLATMVTLATGAANATSNSNLGKELIKIQKNWQFVRAATCACCQPMRQFVFYVPRSVIYKYRFAFSTTTATNIYVN